MQFLGTIHGRTIIEDVVGVMNGRSGRFVLKAGERLELGDHILDIGHTRYAIRVVWITGDPSKPQCYEFICTNALGHDN